MDKEMSCTKAIHRNNVVSIGDIFIVFDGETIHHMRVDTIINGIAYFENGVYLFDPYHIRRLSNGNYYWFTIGNNSYVFQSKNDMLCWVYS